MNQAQLLSSAPAVAAQRGTSRQLQQGHQATPPDADARHFAIEAARLLADSHCDDVLIYDVRGQSVLTDYIIIASGTSDVQMRSVGRHVNQLAQTYDLERYGREHDQSRKWIVLDYVEVMVHLFEPATRAHYDLEMMWGDSPRVAWQRPGGSNGRSRQ